MCAIPSTVNTSFTFRSFEFRDFSEAKQDSKSNKQAKRKWLAINTHRLNWHIYVLCLHSPAPAHPFPGSSSFTATILYSSPPMEKAKPFLRGKLYGFHFVHRFHTSGIHHRFRPHHLHISTQRGHLFLILYEVQYVMSPGGRRTVVRMIYCCSTCLLGWIYLHLSQRQARNYLVDHIR